MFKRILVAVDGSETSMRALAKAIELTRAHGSHLMLVHVVEEVFLNVGEEIVDPRALWSAMTAGGEKVLERMLEQVHAAGMEAESRMIELRDMGETIAGSILREAEAWQADLIVAGTHGRRGWRRILLGSTAEEVARMATMPVLLIRAP
ncbi:MAG: universal stress protein [Halothiobacillaceae bacterium]|nr:MAG: universal stress protein [Halothiobacillaceae bacterium]